MDDEAVDGSIKMKKPKMMGGHRISWRHYTSEWSSA